MNRGEAREGQSVRLTRACPPAPAGSEGTVTSAGLRLVWVRFAETGAYPVAVWPADLEEVV